MADFPNPVPFDLSLGGVLSTQTAMVGVSYVAASTMAWPSANLAIFIPVRLAFTATVYKITIGAGTTATGNFDVGIYDSSGNKLVSSGATAKGTNTEHVLDITDTQIGPGVYYLALSADGTINFVCTAVVAQTARLMGVLQMATAYTLPNTATFAAFTGTVIPQISAHLRST
jgi:hypothetical protein